VLNRFERAKVRSRPVGGVDEERQGEERKPQADQWSDCPDRLSLVDVEAKP